MRARSLLGAVAALVLASCNQSAQAPERHSSAKDPPRVAVDITQPQDTAKSDGDISFHGEWLRLGADAQGTEIYVDRTSVKIAGPGHVVADIGYVGAAGRALERASFNCDEHIGIPTSVIGDKQMRQPDLVDTLSPDDPDGPTVVKYICTKRLPQSAKVLPDLPTHT